MKTELLAPAGSMEALKAAVSAGADAVYLGGAAFGARAYAKNLDEQEILSAIDYVHLRNRKLYLTVNTLLKEEELEEKRIELEHVRGEMEELQRQLDKANKDLEDLLKA